VIFVQRILGDDRIRAEPAAAAELTRLCAHLPLALRIAAANLTHHPHNGIAEYVNELHDGDRLGALAVDGDEQSAVRVAFDHSYARLPEEARRMFRLVGLVPGADFTGDTAAALVASGVPHTQRLLDRLAAAHLIDQPAPGRYAFHDLLRLYATERAHREDSALDRRAALTRLLDHYRTGAVAAMDRAFPEERPGRPGIPIAAARVVPVDPAAARAWLDAARANLVAATGYAAEHGWPGHACDLAATLWLYLTTGPHYTEAIAINTHALRAARGTGERAAEGDALTNLGAVYWRTGRPKEAREYLERALVIRRESGDRDGEGWTLHHLASLSWNGGRYQQFHDRCRQALGIFRTVGDHLGVSKALNNLAMVHWRWGQCEEALGHAEEALAIAREIGDRYTETSALDTLGRLHAHAGRYTAALDSGEQALAIARVIEDRHLEASALNSLGEVLAAAGQPEAALPRHRSARTVAREADDRDEQARALAGLGQALHATGHAAEAHQHWQEAFAIYTDLGVPDADMVRARMSVHSRQ